MSDHVPDPKTWFASIVFLVLAVFIGYNIPRGETAAPVKAAPPSSPHPTTASFTPPFEVKPPQGEFGEMVTLGQNIFHDTAKYAGKFVGNDLRCSNCHLDDGRLPNSAPLWAAFINFPAYRSKNGHVNTFEERLQGCFRFSMNGKAPPLGDKVLVALESYAAFLAKGAPLRANLPGRGYPKLIKPASLDPEKGKNVYVEKCALCHGADGQGQSSADGHIVFPPLWGARSYNWGAGMSSVANAAAFIKANMPFSEGNSLTDAQAWAVAAYVDSHERPQDPRFRSSVQATREAQHNSPFDMYGQVVNGVTLGENSPPSGTVGH